MERDNRLRENCMNLIITTSQRNFVSRNGPVCSQILIKISKRSLNTLLKNNNMCCSNIFCKVTAVWIYYVQKYDFDFNNLSTFVYIVGL